MEGYIKVLSTLTKQQSEINYYTKNPELYGMQVQSLYEIHRHTELALV